MIHASLDRPRPLSFLWALSALTVLCTLGTGCPTGEEEEEDGEVPAPYAGIANPLVGDADAIAAGEPLWTTHCTECHGAKVEHEDEEEEGEDEHGDDYLFWRIAEGVGAEMPAFKDELSEDEIWQVISYLASLEHNH
jgi:mono/diheme cytochrome c family protein